MAKGSKPKMKAWRREAVKYNEDARSSGDFTGHKGRSNKPYNFSIPAPASNLFMKMWTREVGAGSIFYYFTKQEQEKLNETE